MSKTSARADIMRAIRENLMASTPHDALIHSEQRKAVPLWTAASASTIAASTGLLNRFRERLQNVGAHCAIVADENEAARSVESILIESGAARVVTSDAPLIRELFASIHGSFTVQSAAEVSRAGLFECDVGVTAAQWGIAETGTLVLESAHERNRLGSLVPRVHVAVLSASRICATLTAALERVREPDAENILANRCVTFITGPSRTSDIELTLVIGVHGPQALHVIVIEDITGDAAARADRKDAP